MKTLYVLGNGPSLKEVDLKQLNGRDTFGLNGAYRIYDSLNWYPKYYGLLDDYKKRTWTYSDINRFLLSNTPIEKYFFFECERNNLANIPEANYLNLISPGSDDVEYDKNCFEEPYQFPLMRIVAMILEKQEFVEWLRFNEEAQTKLTARGMLRSFLKEPLTLEHYLLKPRFKLSYILPKQLDEFFYFGTNAAVVACQIGICLGYKRIVLLGVDCKWTKQEGKEYSSKDNHWFDGYWADGKYDTVPPFGPEFDPIKMQLNNWNSFQEALEAINSPVKIFNCNQDSGVECFPKRNLEDELLYEDV